MENTDKNGTNSQTKTIYDTGAVQVFWKNFLAGFGRALGGIFVYLILLVIVYLLFINIVLPKMTPYLNMLADLAKSLESISAIKNNPGSLIPSSLNFQKILGQ